MDLMTYLLAIQKIQEVSSDTTYTLTADVQNKTIVLTPSVGTAQVITVPYATDASTVNGKNVPELENGKIPASYLPSYVDDVEEYEDQEYFPSMGESNKIYIDLTTNKIYRWSGTTYVEISESLALGETSSTAFRGDHGKTAYDHSLITSGNPHNVTKTDIGLDNVGNFKAVSTVVSQGLTTTEQENAKANIGLGAAADKDIDISIEEFSQSTNLPTTKAVSDFVQTQTDKVVGTIKSVSNLPAPIASFSGAAALPMPKLKIAIEPQQDLHGYDSPWVGGAGKNKYIGSPSFEDYTNYSAWTLSSEKYNGHDVMYFNGRWLGLYKDLVLAPNTYTFSSMVKVDSATTIYIYNIDGSPLSSTNVSANTWTKISATFTINETKTERIRVESNTVVTLSVSEYQLEINNQATNFEPYSNICPIIGWDECKVGVCGVNIATTEIYKNNYVLASDGTENYVSGFIITKEVKIDSSKDYYLSMVGEQSSSSDAIRVGFYDKYLNFISRVERSSPTLLTIPDNAEYIRLSYRNITPYFKDIQIEEGTTATTYSPYNGQTYTLDLDGTRYGGKVDLVSGVLVVDRGILTLNGSEDYYTIQSSSVDGNTVLRVVTGQACKQNENQKSNYGTFDNYAWQPLESRANTFVLGSEGNLYLQLPSNTASTVEEFKALFASNNLQVVYELATPLTIQLSPTVVKSLLVSNVWSDTGNILDAQYISYEYDKICAKYSENIIPTDDFALNTTTGDITTDGDIIRKNGYWGDTYGGTHTSLIDAIDDLYNLIQKNNS